MSETSRPPTIEGLDYRFAGYGYQNWRMDGAPPVVVNPAATMHAKVAWCWGEMKQIDELASVMCTSENKYLAGVGDMLMHKAVGLIAMLEHLAEATLPEDRSANPIEGKAS